MKGKMVKGKGVGEGRRPEARTHRPVGCNLAVQSRPQAVFLAALTLAGRSQGCTKVFPGAREIRGGGRARVRYRPSKSSEIIGADRWIVRFWGGADIRARSEKIKWGYRCIAKGAFLTLVPRRGSDIFRSVNEFFQPKIYIDDEKKKDSESITRSAGLIFVARM